MGRGPTEGSLASPGRETRRTLEGVGPDGTALSLPFSARDSFPSCSPSLTSLSPVGTCSQDPPKEEVLGGVDWEQPGEPSGHWDENCSYTNSLAWTWEGRA